MKCFVYSYILYSRGRWVIFIVRTMANNKMTRTLEILEIHRTFSCGKFSGPKKQSNKKNIDILAEIWTAGIGVGLGSENS